MAVEQIATAAVALDNSDQPFLRTDIKVTTMFGGIGSSGAMKVAALLTSAQSGSEKMAPSIFSYSNLVHAVSGAVVSFRLFSGVAVEK